MIMLMLMLLLVYTILYAIFLLSAIYLLYCTYGHQCYFVHRRLDVLHEEAIANGQPSLLRDFAWSCGLAAIYGVVLLWLPSLIPFDDTAGRIFIRILAYIPLVLLGLCILLLLPCVVSTVNRSMAQKSANRQMMWICEQCDTCRLDATNPNLPPDILASNLQTLMMISGIVESEMLKLAKSNVPYRRHQFDQLQERQADISQLMANTANNLMVTYEKHEGDAVRPSWLIVASLALQQYQALLVRSKPKSTTDDTETLAAEAAAI